MKNFNCRKSKVPNRPQRQGEPLTRATLRTKNKSRSLCDSLSQTWMDHIRMDSIFVIVNKLMLHNDQQKIR